MSEELLLAENGVQVTTARFVVGQHSYPIATITSVAPYTVKPKTASACALAVFALLVSPAALTCGSVLLGLGCFAVLAASMAYAATRRTTHVIAVASAGFPVHALVSTDVAFTNRVLAVLKQSISMR